MITKKKIGVISLGCDKNRVDTEKMLAILEQKHQLVGEIENAQIIIVNTCAFLQRARKEAVEEIISAFQYKESGSCEKIIVTGCLPQKFVGDLYDEFVEVDAFLGVSDYGEILDVIDKIYQGQRVNAVKNPRGECGIKRVLTTSNFAYLKIADGCSNHCTYCLIPKIRGVFRSVPLSDLIDEASSLGELNELVLVAQDVAKYGQDLSPKTSLVELIRKLSALSNVKGIRLLYCYPENVTDELIHELKTNAKLIRYIDIPLQHADDKILKLMNRKGSGQSYLELIEKLKREVKGIAIRSTFITGFPSETEENFDNLVEFIKKAKLFNAGFFAYSKEQDTPAERLPGHLPQSVKTKRLKKLYSVQKAVVKSNLKTLIGKTFKVVAEGFDFEQLCYYGRAYFNAPEIDGKVYFFSDDEVINGQFYNVKIIKATGYDLYGEKQ